VAVGAKRIRTLTAILLARGRPTLPDIRHSAVGLGRSDLRRSI
jgi:hypothetical protein